MRRREFITLLGGTVVAWPLAARAQQAAKVPVMVSRGRSQDEARGDTAAFLQGLNEFGYVDSTLVLRVTRSHSCTGSLAAKSVSQNRVFGS